MSILYTVKERERESTVVPVVVVVSRTQNIQHSPFVYYSLSLNYRTGTGTLTGKPDIDMHGGLRQYYSSIFSLASSQRKFTLLYMLSATAFLTNTIFFHPNFCTKDVSFTSFKSSIYHFPVEPLYNVQSVVEGRIGETVLNDPVLNPFRNCAATVQYELQIVSLTTSGSVGPTTGTWILQSMMLQRKGNAMDDKASERKSGAVVPLVVPKSMGGDELYVEWMSNTDMGVATVTDQHDGTYLLEFTRPPAYQYNMTNNIPIINIGLGNDAPADSRYEDSDESFGQLVIHYHYTCGVAGYYALERQNFTGIGDVRESLIHFHLPKPRIQEFIPPNDDGAIDLSKYDVVIPFGDSVIREFYKQIFLRNNSCEHPTNYQHTGHSLSTRTDLLVWLDVFNTTYGYFENYQNNESIALITGSSVWDLLAFHNVFSGALRPDMMEHLTTVREFIAAIRTAYPEIDIYWKSPSALHLHRRDVQLWTNPLNSYQTASDLNVAQRELMKELDVPFLDLYDSYYLSATWTKQNDTMHYAESTLPTLLVSYFWPGLMDQFEYCHQTLVTPYVHR